MSGEARHNFLGVKLKEGENVPTDNFLGVGKDRAEAADASMVNFLGVGSGNSSDSVIEILGSDVAESSNATESSSGAEESVGPDPDISVYFQPEKDGGPCQQSSVAENAEKTEPPESFLMTKGNANDSDYIEEFLIEVGGENSDSNLDSYMDVTGNGAGFDAYTLTDPDGKDNLPATDNFLGIGQQARETTSQSLDSFLDNVAESETDQNGPRSVHNSEPWAEVKVEIDVADDEYESGETNYHPDSRIIRTSHPFQKAPLRLMKEQTGEPSLDNGSGSPTKSQGESAESHRTVLSCTDYQTICDENSADVPENCHVIKAEPESDEYSENVPASVWGQGEVMKRGNNSVSSDNYLMSSASSTWSSFVVQRMRECEDNVRNNNATNPAPKSPDPHFLNFNAANISIKQDQEPMTELPGDHMTGFASIERIIMTTGSSSDATELSSHDLVVKMETDSDQETIIADLTESCDFDDMIDNRQQDFGAVDNCHDSSPEYNGKEPISRQRIKTKLRTEKTHPYHCEECSMAFAKKSRLTEHSRTHTDERPHQCQHCSISFRKAVSLKVHTRTHTGELPFRCEECLRGFKCPEELKRHKIRQHLAVRPFACPECDSRFFSKADLRCHRKVHSGVKPYKCPDCPAAFYRSSTLTCHVRIHTGQKPYTCEECDKRFRRSDQLNRHMKTHGEKGYKCDKCDASFHYSSHLKRHGARKHSNVKPFSCPDCGNRFYTNDDLKLHRLSHLGIKPHACPDCHAAFARASDLKVHVRIHTGERPYACKLCGAKFMRSSDLRLHVNKHEGRRPYACPLCGLTFRRSADLSRHKKTHSKLKPFACDDCPAAFANSSDLKRHGLRVHKKDVTKFGCPECDRRFFSQRGLEMHLMRHSVSQDAAAFPCSLCTAAFPHQDLLSDHMTKLHGDDHHHGGGGGGGGGGHVTQPPPANESEEQLIVKLTKLHGDDDGGGGGHMTQPPPGQ